MLLRNTEINRKITKRFESGYLLVARAGIKRTGKESSVFHYKTWGVKKPFTNLKLPTSYLAIK